jgi:hypothetical protein
VRSLGCQHDIPDIDYGHRWKYALAFRWGGDFYALLGASIAAAAYATARQGVVLDCEENRILTAQQALEAARSDQRVVRDWEKRGQFGCSGRTIRLRTARLSGGVSLAGSGVVGGVSTRPTYESQV